MEKKKMNKKTLFIILGLLLIGILTVTGTYAYFAWNSTAENKDATVEVSSVNGEAQCSKISDNNKLLYPVSSRNNGRIVSLHAKQTLSQYASITWTLTINSINTQNTETDGLKHQSFKYELVNTTTGESYGSGNFSELDVGDTITFENEDELLSYNTNYTFTLYLWIDGTIGINPSDMINQTFDFDIVCDITGTSETDNSTPLSDFIYVLGSDQTTISTISADFYNQSTGTISKQNNVALSSPININSNEVLLIRYIGSNTEVNIPKKYLVDGNQYKTVVLTYVSDGSNLSTGVFYHNSSIETISFDRTKYISLNSSGNGYDNNSMYNTFVSCTSLKTVSSLPSTVTNISNIFSGCTSLTSLDLSNVNLANITTYTNALNGVSTSIPITVPNCTQYRLFRAMFSNSYTGLTITNASSSDFNCYQQVEYIQSSGTQYIDTGIKANNLIGIFIDADICQNNATDNIIIGSRGTTTNSRFWVDMDWGNSDTIGVGFNTYTELANRYSIAGKAGERVEITLNYKNDRTAKINDNTFDNLSGRGTLSAQSNNITIFCVNDNGTKKTFTSTKCYKVKISQGNDDIRDFIPCYRLSDNVVGMYDLVNDVFYTNAGSGIFTKGPDVN